MNTAKMRKTRSVDFSRMQIRASTGSGVASQFSRRAARGSFKSLHDYSDDDADGMKCDASDCTLHQRRLVKTERRWSAHASSDLSTAEEKRPVVSLAKLVLVLFACATLLDMLLTNMSSSHEERPRVSLGSAAIASVTETLSPILPFAGGLDLRRDDYWLVSEDSTWFRTLQSVAQQVQDAFRSKEKDAAHAALHSGNASHSVLLKSQRPSLTFDMPISSPQPFVSLDTISQLTLGDIGECFRYAMESSAADFKMDRFLVALSDSPTVPFLTQVLAAMQEAVRRSRGPAAQDWVRPTSTATTDSSVDALKFAAAMRVFAEWRLLRQVPEGYKGFAIGMSLGHKDVVQNVIKMEEAVHSWIQYHHGSEEDRRVATPTLQQLLLYEIETGVHPANRLPLLKEKSAGMGLLWVRRQLAYQTQIFDNVLNMGSKYASMKEAVGAAYSQVYDPYHGWAVQKIFSYSFQAAPEAEAILRHMNPHRLRELLGGSAGETDHRSTENEDTHPLGQLLHHLGTEWDKLASHVGQIFQPSLEESADAAPALDEAYITAQMVQDAHAQIQHYLHIIRPLLHHLQDLFDELNMDDPTRV